MSSGSDEQPIPSGSPDPGSENPDPSAGAMPPPPTTPPPPAMPPPPATAPPPAVVRPRSSSTSGYPIDLGLDVADRIARWRPLVHWILAIPLLVVLYVLRIVAGLCAFIGWFVALFTARMPESLGTFIAGYYRYQWRTYSYIWFLREKYPPFAFEGGYADPGDDPAWFEVRPVERLSRLAVLFRFILVLPQAIVLIFLGIALAFALLVAFFAVLITGRWPVGLRDFVIRVERWFQRVDAWYYLIANPYPPFSLD